MHCRDQLLAAISVELSAIRRHYRDCCEELQQLDAKQEEARNQRSAMDKACAESYAQIDEIKQQLVALEGAPEISSEYVSENLLPGFVYLYLSLQSACTLVISFLTDKTWCFCLLLPKEISVLRSTVVFPLHF